MSALPFILFITSSGEEKVAQHLTNSGVDADILTDWEKGAEQLDQFSYHLVILEWQVVREKTQLNLLQEKAREYSNTPFLMICPPAQMDKAFHKVQGWVYTLLPSSMSPAQLQLHIDNAINHYQLIEENDILKRKTEEDREITGKSPSIKKIKETVQSIAATPTHVFLLGGRGTGKEVVAKWIHNNSSRAEHPWMKINCLSHPSSFIESELFGTTKEPSSVARQSIGKIERARGGTLYLNEVTGLPLPLQERVAQLIEDQKNGKPDQKTTRLIASSRKDIHQLIEDEKFSLSLYNALGQTLIHMPSLNERIEDIPLLADEFLEEICYELGEPKTLTPKAKETLKQVHWQANIRELYIVIERLALLTQGEKITDEMIEQHILSPLSDDSQIYQTTEQIFKNFSKLQPFKASIEKRFIEYQLQKNDWNVLRTAEQLDIQRSHLYNKIKKYNLKRQ